MIKAPLTHRLLAIGFHAEGPAERSTCDGGIIFQAGAETARHSFEISQPIPSAAPSEKTEIYFQCDRLASLPADFRFRSRAAAADRHLLAAYNAAANPATDVQDKCLQFAFLLP